MRENIILIFKGFMIGIGKIIPGVSGSLIAITLGVYEKSIAIISNIFSFFYKNVLFLGMLGIGVLISVMVGSKVIVFFLNQNYFLTMCLFVGLIVGTIPNVLKEIRIKRRFDYIYIIVPILFIVGIELINLNNSIEINNNFSGYMYTIFLGFIDALTMIVPGVSGTAIFILLGCYEFILNLFSNFLTPFTLFFVIGLFLGVIIVSNIINYLFKYHKRKLYLVILGLVIASFFFLIKDLVFIIPSFLQLIVGLCLCLLGFFISKKLDT